MVLKAVHKENADDKLYCAPEQTEAVVDFWEDTPVLEAQGVIFDMIQEIGSGDYWAQRSLWADELLRGEQRVCPTGIPQVQAYFRTLIADDSGFGYGKPGFRNEDCAKKFFDLAVGFMWRMRKSNNIGEEIQERMPQFHMFNDYV